MSVLLRASKWPKIRTQNWPNQHIQISLERFGFWQWLLKTQMSFIYVSTTSIIGLLSSTTSEQSNGPSHNTGRIPQYEDWPYFYVNALLHLEQASGYSPVWILLCLSMYDSTIVTLSTRKSNFVTNTFLWMLCCIWGRQVASLLYGSFHVCPWVITNLSHWPLENQILQPILFCECFDAYGAGKWLLSCVDPFMSIHVW